MEKPANTDHPIHDLLRRRWSPRAFSQRPVPSEALQSILEAARWAPSAMNEQPWRFVVATREDPEAFEALLGCLVDGNRVWACRAPVLVLAAVKMDFERNGRPNRHAWYDVGQAVAHLAIQATDLGLFVHQMGGFDREKARVAFALPDGCEPVAVVALGYGDDPETLPESLREREVAPRGRRPAKESLLPSRRRTS
ncbi:MAG: nitroreductase family protein [Armatimonadetes bacterium]|nr:nitroreductase family protein [Armatimonadota bacterium]